MIKCHRLSGLNNSNLYSQFLVQIQGGWQDRLVPGPLFGFRRRFSPGSSHALPSVPICVLIVSYKGNGLVGQAALMTAPYLHSCKTSTKYRHTLRSWGQDSCIRIWGESWFTARCFSTGSSDFSKLEQTSPVSSLSTSLPSALW